MSGRIPWLERLREWLRRRVGMPRAIGGRVLAGALLGAAYLAAWGWWPR